MSLSELVPFKIIVLLISTGGADQVTHVTLPAETRLVTVFPVGLDIWLTDVGAAGTAVDDARAFPLLANQQNESKITGWSPDGPILRLAGAVNTKVRILCQK